MNYYNQFLYFFSYYRLKPPATTSSRGLHTVLYWISPGGLFVGCSKPIKGCISDRDLLAGSDLPEITEEGDRAAADHGFANCEDIFAAKKATFLTPPFKPKDGGPMSLQDIF